MASVKYWEGISNSHISAKFTLLQLILVDYWNGIQSLKKLLLKRLNGLKNCQVFKVVTANIGTFVTRITLVFNRDLIELADEFGNKSHQQTHHENLLSRSALWYENEIRYFGSSLANKSFLAKLSQRNRV